MNLFFFGILVASKKHHTFAEVHGDLTAASRIDAVYMVNEYATRMVEKTNDKSLFVVGITLTEANQVRVPDYV